MLIGKLVFSSAGSATEISYHPDDFHFGNRRFGNIRGVCNKPAPEIFKPRGFPSTLIAITLDFPVSQAEGDGAFHFELRDR